MASKQLTSVKTLVAIPFGLVLVDLIFQKTARDPLNPIKFYVLGLLAAWALATIISTKEFVTHLRGYPIVRIYTILICAFILFLLIALLNTPSLISGLLGLSKRNLGFLNYLFLSVIALYTLMVVKLSNVRRLFWTAAGLTTALSIYGALQYTHHDFLNWANPNNPIILFTGNPDFAASLLALLAVLSFSGIFLDIHRAAKVFLSLVTIFAVIDIYYSTALQGLVGIAAGCGFLLAVVVWQKSKSAGIAWSVLGIVFFIFSILGTVNVGPLSRYFYKASVIDRGYDWRAGIHMFKSHPWFGVGLDRYKDYFFQYMSPKYPLIFGYKQNVNNAHNVFLNLFATAGLFVGLSFLLLILFIAYRAYVALRSTTGSQQLTVAGLIAAWIVYVGQLFISVDVPVISLWGWILGASIVAISLSQEEKVPVGVRGKTSNFVKSVNKRYQKESQTTFVRWVAFAAIALGFLFLVIPMNRNEVESLKFSAIKPSSDPNSQDEYRNWARKTLNQPLLSSDYKVGIALDLANNNYFPESIVYLKSSLSQNPRESNAFALLASIYEHLGQTSKAIDPRKKLAALDPYGAENLAALENDYLLMGDRRAAIEIQKAIISMAPGTDVANRATKILDLKVLAPKK